MYMIYRKNTALHQSYASLGKYMFVVHLIMIKKIYNILSVIFKKRECLITFTCTFNAKSHSLIIIENMLIFYLQMTDFLVFNAGHGVPSCKFDREL